MKSRALNRIVTGDLTCSSHSIADTPRRKAEWNFLGERRAAHGTTWPPPAGAEGYIGSADGLAPSSPAFLLVCVADSVPLFVAATVLNGVRG